MDDRLVDEVLNIFVEYGADSKRKERREALSRCIENADWFSICEMFANRAWLDDFYETMTESSNKDVRKRLAADHYASLGIKTKLMHDQESEVRRSLAPRWRTTPPGFLRELAKDPDESVRRGAFEGSRRQNDPWLNS